VPSIVARDTSSNLWGNSIGVGAAEWITNWAPAIASANVSYWSKSASTISTYERRDDNNCLRNWVDFDFKS
jgi:hypothetical protein